MKKVVIIYDFFSEHGGIERVMNFQAKVLRKNGYDVTFAFAYVDEKLKNERLKDFNVIEYAHLPIKNETLQICSSVLMKKIIEKFKSFDLVICHSFPASYLAARIKKHYKIPFILHLHHPPQFLYSADLAWAKNSFKRIFSYTIGIIFRPFLRSFDKSCLKKADYYFVAGNTVKRIIKETYGIDGIVLYPTVDSKFKIIKCSLKDLKKYSVSKPFILGSGRIIRQKRFDYLLESFSKLKNTDLMLVIAGKYDDKEKKYLDKISKELKINVNFLGPVDINDLIKFYNLAKVTVLTCPKEWFGLVPVEALACGSPVVAWKDNFGPEETVTNNETGYLARPYDTEDMSDKIKMALSKKWDKKKLSHSIKKYSDEDQEKVFMKVINKIFIS